MATASRAPWTVAGSRPPAAASKVAPIFSRGAITLPIGRRISEASPVKRALIGVDAMRPIESRAPVPEFPKSSSRRGALEAPDTGSLHAPQPFAQRARRGLRVPPSRRRCA